MKNHFSACFIQKRDPHDCECNANSIVLTITSQNQIIEMIFLTNFSWNIHSSLRLYQYLSFPQSPLCLFEWKATQSNWFKCLPSKGKVQQSVPKTAQVSYSFISNNYWGILKLIKGFGSFSLTLIPHKPSDGFSPNSFSRNYASKDVKFIM